MKEEEFGPIEQDIIKEEPQTPETKTPFPSRFPELLAKIPNLRLSVKKPKAITLIILVLAIFLIYLALNLLGQKQQENNALPQVEQTQQSPPPSQDPSLANITQKVEAYGKKVDSLDTYKKRLTKPIVDLEINFKE